MAKNQKIHGVITHSDSSQRNDYLFRVSLKAVIFNQDGHILVVKEKGRDWWDIPGGGLDHGESIKEALSRELYEEVSLQGDFEYKVILAEDPRPIKDYSLYQMRITFIVTPQNLTFKPGEDGDEVRFIDPLHFKDSERVTDRKIYEYSQLPING